LSSVSLFNYELKSVHKLNYSVMPDLIRHPETLENSGFARSLRSLRLPSVARLEFTPVKTGAGMTILTEVPNLEQT
jgi:hypothetical protein